MVRRKEEEGGGWERSLVLVVGEEVHGCRSYVCEKENLFFCKIFFFLLLLFFFFFVLVVSPMKARIVVKPDVTLSFRSNDCFPSFFFFF